MEPKFPLTTFEDVLAVLVTVPVEYEVTSAGEIRSVIRDADFFGWDGCPLMNIARSYDVPHWDQVAESSVAGRVFFAADKRGPYRPADRALLLQACGLE